MGHILDAKKIVVKYGGVTANNGIDLNLLQGEIHGLIGPNGAGKSTFIDAISGRRQIASGDVFFKDKKITKFDIVQRRLLGLSRSFQRTSIFPEMTVGEQVLLAAVDSGQAEELLRELNLLHLVGERANETGYGDQRRLDIALALASRPSVLLLDEPMAGLSVEESFDLAEHLRVLVRNWGVSVLLVEHDMNVVFKICDRISVLDMGKLIAIGTPGQIRTDDNVRKAYLGTAV